MNKKNSLSYDWFSLFVSDSVTFNRYLNVLSEYKWTELCVILSNFTFVNIVNILLCNIVILLHGSVHSFLEADSFVGTCEESTPRICLRLRHFSNLVMDIYHVITYIRVTLFEEHSYITSDEECTSWTLEEIRCYISKNGMVWNTISETKNDSNRKGYQEYGSKSKEIYDHDPLWENIIVGILDILIKIIIISYYINKSVHMNGEQITSYEDTGRESKGPEPMSSELFVLYVYYAYAYIMIEIIENNEHCAIYKDYEYCRIFIYYNYTVYGYLTIILMTYGKYEPLYTEYVFEEYEYMNLVQETNENYDAEYVEANNGREDHEVMIAVPETQGSDDDVNAYEECGYINPVSESVGGVMYMYVNDDDVEEYEYMNLVPETNENYDAEYVEASNGREDHEVMIAAPETQGSEHNAYDDDIIVYEECGYINLVPESVGGVMYMYVYDDDDEEYEYMNSDSELTENYEVEYIEENYPDSYHDSINLQDEEIGDIFEDFYYEITDDVIEEIAYEDFESVLQEINVLYVPVDDVIFNSEIVEDE